jgi:hypothetical protein
MDLDIALDEYAPLSYDAMLVHVKRWDGFARSAAKSRWANPRYGNISALRVLEGESGTIDFGGRADQQVPLDKFIAVMRVNGPGPPVKQGSCGRHRSHPPSPWCPPAG